MGQFCLLKVSEVQAWGLGTLVFSSDCQNQIWLAEECHSLHWPSQPFTSIRSSDTIVLLLWNLDIYKTVQQLEGTLKITESNLLC